MLDQPDAFRALGVRRYPALVHGDRILAGLFLTRRKIRRFLAAI